MEKSNKLMLGAALVVALVALAGAGYAAYYQAETTNTGNEFSSEYIKLSQTGDGAYAATSGFMTDLRFDTENDAEGSYKYYPVATHSLSETGVYEVVSGHQQAKSGSSYVAKIADALTITADMTNSDASKGRLTVTESGLSVSPLTCTMVLVDATAPETIKAVANGSATLNGTTWTFSNLDLGENSSAWVVYIFVSGDLTTTPTVNQTVSFTFHLEVDF